MGEEVSQTEKPSPCIGPTSIRTAYPQARARDWARLARTWRASVSARGAGQNRGALIGFSLGGRADLRGAGSGPVSALLFANGAHFTPCRHSGLCFSGCGIFGGAGG